MTSDPGGRGRCAVCGSDRQADIEAALAGGESKVQLAKLFGISRRSLTRHQTAHLNPALAQVAQRRTAKGAEKFVDRLETVVGRTQAILEAAMRGDTTMPCPACRTEVTMPHSPNAAQALTAIRELRATLELLGKVTGELDSRPVVVVNLQTTPEWLRLQTSITESLAPFPEARLAVAAELRRIEA